MHVLVVGAGIGGLTFANLLRRLAPGIEVTVLERDAGVTSRPQGYGVGLRQSEGLAVLESLGLADDVARLAQPIESFSILTRRGRILRQLRPDDRGGRGGLVAVSRTAFRGLLVETLDGAVRWGARAEGVRDEGTVATVLLAGGDELTADVVVAADGAGSPVRMGVFGNELRPVGLARIGAVIPRVEHPLVRRGAFMTLGRGSSTFVQAFAADRLVWSFTFRSPVGANDGCAPSELLRRAVAGTSGWHDPLPAILAATDAGDVSVRDLHDLPPSDTVRRGRIVLLGDAAHAMTPYRGVGANMAMVDAAELARAIVGARDVERALDEYVRTMVPRNRAAVQRSHEAAVSLHPAGPFGVLRRDVGLRAAQALARVRSRS